MTTHSLCFDNRMRLTRSFCGTVETITVKKWQYKSPPSNPAKKDTASSSENWLWEDVSNWNAEMASLEDFDGTDVSHLRHSRSGPSVSEIRPNYRKRKVGADGDPVASASRNANEGLPSRKRAKMDGTIHTIIPQVCFTFFSRL